MNKISAILSIILITSLFGINSSYLKTKIKNRASLQQKQNAFKHQKYKYISQQELQKARNKSNVNLGVVDVKRGEQIRNVNVYVDSNSKIDLHNNKRNSKVQIGVVNVGKHTHVESANVVVNAKGGIRVRQNISANQKKVSQIGVVNLKQSSTIKHISTKVKTNKKINIKNH